MKKKVYTRPVSVALSEEMFVQVKTIADNEEIGISDYIREAIREKLATFNQNNIQKGE
jgi:metal-responsive CopG/Arc/MetJ family transcriptional regulator